MARLSIEDLPKPPRAFHPAHTWEYARAASRFETKGKAKREDERRASSIKRLKAQMDTTECFGGATKNGLAALAKAIKSKSGPASARYMRKLRIRLTGSIWALLDGKQGHASSFTLVPRGWEYQGGGLEAADPVRLLEQIRLACMRLGSSEADGWAVLCLHGEHEPGSDKFVLHIHGLAEGGMREVVEKLRSTRLLRSTRQGGRDDRIDPVFRRVRRSRKPLSDLPDPLTYLLQGFWPSRAEYSDEAGKVSRQRKKRRIVEPRHTEVLLWLNRWRPRDLVLLIGLEATPQGLRKTRKVYANSAQLAESRARKT